MIAQSASLAYVADGFIMESLKTPNRLLYGLDPKYFTGQNLFQEESERIFSQHWICVGRIEELSQTPRGDNAFFTVCLGQDNIIVVRDNHGRLGAFHNVCRHRAARLIDQSCGTLKNSCITCPYHAWAYDLDGCLIGAPNMMDVDDFDRSDFSLARIGCVNWCGFILLNLNRPSPHFFEEYSPIIQRLQAWDMHQLRLGQTIEYSVSANWKLLFQNYNECYHCPTVHPELNRLTPYRSATNDLTEGAFLGGPMQLAEGFDTVSEDGKRIAPPFPGLSPVQQRSVYYYTIFPTLFISAHPDYVMVHQIERVTDRSSRVKCHFLIAQNTPESELLRAIRQWDRVNRQDWHVCELTQLGVQSSAYTPGPYSNLEKMLIAFDRHYRNVMTGSREGV